MAVSRFHKRLQGAYQINKFNVNYQINKLQHKNMSSNMTATKTWFVTIVYKSVRMILLLIRPSRGLIQSFIPGIVFWKYVYLYTSSHQITAHVACGRVLANSPDWFVSIPYFSFRCRIRYPKVRAVFFYSSNNIYLLEDIRSVA